MPDILVDNINIGTSLFTLYVTEKEGATIWDNYIKYTAHMEALNFP